MRLHDRGLAKAALAYGYFKSMVWVSLATLGGILNLREAVFEERIVPWQLMAEVLPLDLAGLLAPQAQTDIMKSCQGIKPPLNRSQAAL